MRFIVVVFESTFRAFPFIRLGSLYWLFHSLLLFVIIFDHRPVLLLTNK